LYVLLYRLKIKHPLAVFYSPMTPLELVHKHHITLYISRL